MFNYFDFQLPVQTVWWWLLGWGKLIEFDMSCKNLYFICLSMYMKLTYLYLSGGRRSALLVTKAGGQA